VDPNLSRNVPLPFSWERESLGELPSAHRGTGNIPAACRWWATLHTPLLTPLSFLSKSIEGSPGEISRHQMACHFPSLPMCWLLWCDLSEFLVNLSGGADSSLRLTIFSDKQQQSDPAFLFSNLNAVGFSGFTALYCVLCPTRTHASSSTQAQVRD
jgi:hypothetical protein